MRYYEATSVIAASPEAVWSVLSDGPGWTTWDSGVILLRAASCWAKR